MRSYLHLLVSVTYRGPARAVRGLGQEAVAKSLAALPTVGTVGLWRETAWWLKYLKVFVCVGLLAGLRLFVSACVCVCVCVCERVCVRERKTEK